MSNKDGENDETKVYTVSRFPEYAEPFLEYFLTVCRSLLTVKNEVLSKMATVSTERTGPIRTPIEGNPIDFEPVTVETTFKIPNTAILNSEVEQLIVSIDEASDSELASLMPQIFKFISDVCEASGQVVHGNGQPFSWEHIIELYEKVEMSFDEEGNPSQLLVTHPDMIKVMEENPPTEEQQRRMEQVKERKRAEFFAKKRTRKLL